MKNIRNFVSSKLARGRNDVALIGWHFIMSPNIDYALAAPRPARETARRFLTCETLTTRSAAIFLSKHHTMSHKSNEIEERMVFAALVAVISNGEKEEFFSHCEPEEITEMGAIWDKYCGTPVGAMFNRPDFKFFSMQARSKQLIAMANAAIEKANKVLAS